jgi:ABC-type transport system substrate-binding protein
MSTTRGLAAILAADGAGYSRLIGADEEGTLHRMQSIREEIIGPSISTFPLHRGVKWHDGKPFTAKDVKCTWDLLMGSGEDKLRVNPRKAWYSNVKEVTTKGDYEVAFHLNRPQQTFPILLPVPN